MTDLALILAAILLAATGGDAFLKSILGAALHLRVPKMVVATTLAAFATSSPELTVSSVAALAGQPKIGLGDALGSNVVNIARISAWPFCMAPYKPRARISTTIFIWPWASRCATGIGLSLSRLVNCRSARACSSAYWVSAP